MQQAKVLNLKAMTTKCNAQNICRKFLEKCNEDYNVKTMCCIAKGEQGHTRGMNNYCDIGMTSFAKLPSMQLNAPPKFEMCLNLVYKIVGIIAIMSLGLLFGVLG